MTTSVINGFETELRTYTCAQSWHSNVEKDISYNVRVPKGTKDRSCEEALEAYKAVCGAEFCLSCIESALPIEARKELKRQACQGSENTTRDKLDKALAFMPCWNYVPSEAKAAPQLRAENTQLKGQLAAAELNQLREKRKAAALMIQAGQRELALQIYGEAVVSAVEIKAE